MSYTTFKLSNIKTEKKKHTNGDKIIIHSDLSNTGPIDEAEVIQVYLGKLKSKVKRDLKELKGFKKMQLRKGEKKSVSIQIDVSKLALYDTTISRWSVEKHCLCRKCPQQYLQKKIKIQ